MIMQIGNSQSMFTLSMQQGLSLPKVIGKMQNLGLQKVVAQVNAAFANKENRDIVELSKKAQSLLNTNTKETEKEETFGYQKYPEGIPQQKWAEGALKWQQTGVNTLSDAIGYEKEKLKFTISKINELENFLNGTGSHSDPNMTKELAATYLQNYKQSIKNNYEDIISSINGFKYFANEYDDLSGGMVSEMIGNVLGSVTLESLGLDNLSDNPEEILKALESASKVLDDMTEKIGNAYSQVSGGEKLTAGSWRPGANAFNKEYFASKMECASGDVNGIALGADKIITIDSTIHFDKGTLDLYL